MLTRLGLLGSFLVLILLLAFLPLLPAEPAPLTVDPVVSSLDRAEAVQLRVSRSERRAAPLPPPPVVQRPAKVVQKAVVQKPKKTTSPRLTPSKTDPTVGLSRSQRSKVPFAVWIVSPTAVRVAWRESHNVCSITNPSGKYQGKWQMDDNFWRSYGGLRYAPNPHQASCSEQDLVAYRGWLSRGWQPWPTA
jgi:hypothetical protein